MNPTPFQRSGCAPLGAILALLLLPTLSTGVRAQPPSDEELFAEEVEIEVDASPPETTEAPDNSNGNELESLRRELEELRRQVQRLEHEPKVPVVEAEAAEPESTPAPAPRPQESSPLSAFLAGLSLSGYVQAQYLHSELSEDQLQQGQIPLNLDGFTVRRGRIRLAGTWAPLANEVPLGVELEIDANTANGADVSVRRSNVWIGYSPEGLKTPPWVALRVGLTEIPFGLELRQNQDERLFMERTTGSEALFAGPTDLGVRLSGLIGPFTYDLAATNGTPVSDRGGAFQNDPTAAPDWAGRLGVVHTIGDWLDIQAGASALYGTGFHPGRDAEKARLEWRDLNEDGVLSTGETIAVPARGATPSQTFDRWAVGVDLSLAIRWWAGTTRLFGEAVMASNLDRTFFVADPVFAGADLREFYGYAALLQDITPWAFVGFRYDFYDPDLDLLDARRGTRVPVDAALHTFSPIVGGRILGFARVSVQYDHVLDALGRDSAGLPTDLGNNRVTVRFQGSF